jgi:pyrrolidone-carboxylate peptidase
MTMTRSKKSRHWLITAFEPFANRKQNNSMLVLDEIKKLEQENRANDDFHYVFHYAVLPVVYATCFTSLDKEVNALFAEGIKLEGVLGLGEGAEEFKLETQAHNIDDVPEVADNAGEIRSGKKIFSDYPVDIPFPLRFPFEAFSRIRTSKNAGFFICNHISAEMSVQYGKSDRIPYFGFIHVPKVGSGGMFTPDVCAAVIVNSFKKIV